jgi:hypothetical protein
VADRRRPDRLEEALRGLLHGRPRRPAPPPDDLGARLANVERELQDVRTRINALFFTVLTAVVGDIAGRLVLG